MFFRKKNKKTTISFDEYHKLLEEINALKIENQNMSTELELLILSNLERNETIEYLTEINHNLIKRLEINNTPKFSVQRTRSRKAKRGMFGLFPAKK